MVEPTKESTTTQTLGAKKGMTNKKIEPIEVTNENFGDLLIESLKEHIAIKEGRAEAAAIRTYPITAREVAVSETADPECRGDPRAPRVAPAFADGVSKALNVAPPPAARGSSASAWRTALAPTAADRPGEPRRDLPLRSGSGSAACPERKGSAEQREGDTAWSSTSSSCSGREKTSGQAWQVGNRTFSTYALPNRPF